MILLIIVNLVREEPNAQLSLCGPGPSGGMCRDVGPHRSKADNCAAGVEMRSIMINAIGAMHATLCAKKRPAEESQLQVEVKKRRRIPTADESDDHSRQKQTERGRTA